MDNSEDYTHAWATPVGAGLAGCVGGVILVVAAVVVAGDPAGSVLMGVAGVLLLALGAYTLLVRPRLAISSGPSPVLVIRTLRGPRAYPRERIERIRVLSIRRVGRRVGQLEIDVLDDEAVASPPDAHDAGPRDDTRLVVLSRWDLGTDLPTVVDALREAGFVVDEG
ncbi:PH domain-containing protein [Gordonia sp. HS-NH1]|uniref:PH domain-containing protein n=1 Tax=Gordonia sp. HS-NH1 TaxID=1435068 RepID=UPI0006E20370|nr:PH domain-containing protein [Gordonia sp. HS-NH1]